jgi:hypothetical protein
MKNLYKQQYYIGAAIVAILQMPTFITLIMLAKMLAYEVISFQNILSNIMFVVLFMPIELIMSLLVIKILLK